MRKRKRHPKPLVGLPKVPRSSAPRAYGKHILRAATVATDVSRKREFHLHATKGYRSYKPEA